MTPFRMRLFVVVFLALATAISVNALYMQDAPQVAGRASRAPAPIADLASHSTAATAALPKQEAAGRASGGAHATPAGAHGEVEAFLNGTTQTGQSKPPPQSRQPARPVPERLVKAIQRELARRGYGVGPEIGRLDVTTRAAIIAYEFDEGMPLTGEAGETLLKTLIFGEAMGKSGPGSAGRFEQRRKLIEDIQHRLALMGYISGPADGRLDSRTRNAIRRFAADRDLGDGGQINARVLLEMVIVSGKPFDAHG